MDQLSEPLIRLQPPERRHPPSLPADFPELDERPARRALRGQIATMERELGSLFGAAYPRRGLQFAVPGVGGPRLLGLAQLEAVRDSLAGRLQDVRRALTERGYVEQGNRELIERMIAAPQDYKFVRVSNEDIGEPGCRHWHSRPRLGLLGMLFGWWRVKVSSGCP